MKREMIYIWLIVLIITIVAPACVKSYNPPQTDTGNYLLVVDGNINVGSETVIKMTRSRAIADSSLEYEQRARVFIEEENGNTYQLNEDTAGIYTSHGAAVVAGNNYRLKILTEAGKEYLSDYIKARETPDIDSVSWIQDDDVNIYVNTHDPLNNTRYYRWEFEETWEYHSVFDSYLDFKDGQLIFLEPDQYRYTCYKTNKPGTILLGSSAALANDVISKMPVTSVPNDNSKIAVRYSILVKQYALSPGAYKYWQIVKQNTQPDGNLFDPQPSQLFGNIRCSNNPEEPVIGYINVSSEKQKRIFIRWGELRDRKPYIPGQDCKEIIVPLEEAPKLLESGARLPAYLSGSTGPIAIVPAACVDCRKFGGTTAVPWFW